MEDLIKLKGILQQLLPESQQILNVVSLTVSKDGIERIIFSNDNFKKDNVAVVGIDYLEAPTRSNITVFSTRHSSAELREILQKTLNWDEELEFAGLNEEQIDIIKGLCDNRSKDWIYTYTHVYGLWPKTTLIPVTPSTPVCYSPLSDSHASLLNSYWKFRDGQTEAMISGLARLGKVFGLMIPQQEIIPVAWMVMYSQGSLGMLRTREGFRNLGLGSYLVEKVVGETLKQGISPYVHIEDDNQASQNFFTRLGFIQREPVVWINHYPSTSNEKKVHI